MNTPIRIAIIGMAGRFPGASTVGQFWNNLVDGTESISFFTDHELLSSGVEPELLKDPGYVRANGVLRDVELFDAEFFGFSPREAELTDPQHRIFLETAWEAFENAGYNPTQQLQRSAVYAGAGFSTYLLHNLMRQPEFMRRAGGLQLLMGNHKDYVATRVSYKLNLKGPSVNVGTACSTSLVAVHLACQSLLDYQCDIALAGGVSIQVPQKQGYLYDPNGIVSSDGHCRAFDARATGTIGGNGCAIVVLKRLEDAIRDKDRVRAVILGSAMNNDGSAKVGYTAPSVEGQAEVIAEAHAVAEIDPETITYIETHGTGTRVGDPIEVSALAQAFAAQTKKKGFCAIGSVKTNVGHLDEAAGVAGLIKTVLALEHRLIPPSLHYEQANPEIDFAGTPFFVNHTLSAWPESSAPRRAGVSSFGIGGTNVHVVMEEAPSVEPPSAGRPWPLLLLSARSSAALETATARLIDHFKEYPDTCLPDAAYTLQVGRKPFEHRRAAVCRTASEAVATLESRAPKRVFAGVCIPDPSLVFMFPGQGTQYPNMGRRLYDTEPVFRKHVDECSEKLRPRLGFDLRSIIFTDAKALNQTAYTQPALFVIEYALSCLWMSWGIRPAAMIGHSIGEYVAACLAGVLSADDALDLVVERGRLMQALHPGSMVAVPLSELEIRPLMSAQLSIAAINSPSLCVVSGTAEDVAEFERRMVRAGVVCHSVRTSHAFHSQMMDPIVEAFRERMGKVRLNRPQIPFISNLSGTWITPEEATDPAYWARHLRETVRFSEGIEELAKVSGRVFLEVGPGRSLATGVTSEHVVLATMRRAQDDIDDAECLMATLGRLWVTGVDVDWKAFYGAESRSRVSLPGYPFERKRYWVEPEPQAVVQSGRANLDNWFYVPSWKRSELADRARSSSDRLSSILILGDQGGLSQRLAARMRKEGHRVVTASAGSAFAQIDSTTFILNPTEPEDHRALIERLATQSTIPTSIVHLWSVTNGGDDLAGFYSLLFFAQALGDRDRGERYRLTVVSSEVQCVTRGESLSPEKATLLGAVRVIPQEYPDMECRSVDIVPSEDADIAAALAREIEAGSTDVMVAYRANQRWVQTFEPHRVDRVVGRGASIRKDGTYLITGGMGGIGFVIAQHLAQVAGVNLILIGRSATNRLDQVRDLERRGAQVLAVAADVTDRDGMRSAIEEARRRFGRIHGVIHAAGIPDGALIMRRTRELTGTVLAPKVRGTLVLDELLAGDPPEFVILCSALSSILGGAGQAGYAAANAFLDAFAHLKTFRDHIPTTAINWDAWREVGMAAADRRQRIPVTNRIFDEAFLDSHGNEIHVSRLGPQKHWMLAEHRIGKTPVLPGTAYLELARAAFEKHAGVGIVEIRDVYFLTPLMVQDGQETEVRTILKPGSGSCEFTIISKAGPGDQWQEHSRGTIGIVESVKPRTAEPNWEDGMSEIDPALIEEKLSPFGPRWRNVRRLRLGNDCGVASLELSSQYTRDLDDCKLHPALLDIATGIVAIMSGFEGGLPFSYGSVRMHGALTGRIISWVRGRETDHPGRTLKADVIITDAEGRVLVEIADYTLRSSGSESNGGLDEAQNVCLTISTPGAFHTLSFQPATRREPGEHEVEIEVGAAGLNFKDVLFALGMLPPEEAAGIRLGLECAGTVVRVGHGVRHVRPGDSVIAFAPSSFARYTTTRADLVTLKPARLTVVEAATIPAAFMTAYYALVRLARLRPGERVLIHAAAGGVGMAAVTIAQWVGAEVFATAGSPEKRDFLRTLGVRHVMNSRTLEFADEIREITSGRGVDVVLNSLAGEFIPKSISVLAPYGRFLEVGVRDIYNNTSLELRPFQKCLSFFAVGIGADLPDFAGLFAEVTAHFDRGDFQPLPYRAFSPKDVVPAFEWMAAAKHIGKLVVSFEEGRARTMRLGEILGETEPSKGIVEDDFLRNGILPAEGVEVFERILGSGKPQVVVSTVDLGRRLAQLTRVDPAPPPATIHDRPNLTSAYLEARNETEQVVAGVWQGLLGISPIGVHDSFFELGGDSLLAAQVMSRLHKAFSMQIPLSSLLECPTVEGLAARIAEIRLSRSKQESGIPNTSVAPDYELSHAQRRLWFLSQIEAVSTAYNIPLHQLIEGEISRDYLETAMRRLVERHESLRTTFITVEGEPRQKIHAEIDVKIHYLDLSARPQPIEDARQRGREEAALPFDLEVGPLFRVFLLKLDRNRHALLFTIHHIVCDGVSIGVLARDLGSIYTAIRRGTRDGLPPLRIQYRDFTAWQNALVESDSITAQREYWKTRLQSPLPVLNLPADFPRSSVQTFGGDELPFSLGPELTSALLAFARQRNASLFMVLLALLKVLLYRYSGQDDIIVGSPIAGRNEVDLEHQVGYYLNMLPLRDTVEGHLSFDAFLQRVRKTAMEAYDHQIYPFDRLIDELNVDRDLSRSPLFDIVLILQNQEDQGLQFDSGAGNPFFEHSGTSKFDLTFSFKQLEDDLVCGIEYNTELFLPGRIRRMSRHFIELVRHVLEEPLLALERLEIMPDEELRLLHSFSNTRVPYSESTVVDLFAAQAARTPGAVAVTSEEAEITYGELDRRSNHIGNVLKSMGAGPGVLVGLCVDRSCRMLGALLGVLKSGSAYVPLDPAFPRERLDFMVSDSGMSLIVTEEHLKGVLPEHGVRTLLIEQLDHTGGKADTLLPILPWRCDPWDVAYVLYTSGSTGVPKGVQVEHRSLANFLLSMAERPGLVERDVLLAVTTLSFDIAGLELYLPLVCGARVVLASSEVSADGLRLKQALEDYRPTVMQGTPATWRLLLEAGWEGRKDLKILCGGEALTRDLAVLLHERGGSLWNLYGPTETTIWSTVFEAQNPEEKPESVVSIGRPIANTQVHVLDRNLRPAPVGIPGELCIGGTGVARGYLDRPALTAEKFISDPFSSEPGARLYRTGDMALYYPDGTLGFLGRADQQFKVRGFRIEGKEIEAVLAAHPAVEQAVVVAEDNQAGEKDLVAYVRLSAEASDQTLRFHLNQRLPHYMVPAQFVPVEMFPRTPNGKVDLRALARLKHTRLQADWADRADTHPAPPTDQTESELVELWRVILNVDVVGTDQNFFELGGHSLKATKLLFNIERTLGIRLTLLDIFGNPTVAGLAHLIRQKSRLQPAEIQIIAPPTAEELELLNE